MTIETTLQILRRSRDNLVERMEGNRERVRELYNAFQGMLQEQANTTREINALQDEQLRERGISS